MRVNDIHKSLNEERLLAGVERTPAVLNFVVCAFVLYGLFWFWWIPITCLIHFLLRYSTKRDSKKSRIYLQYIRLGLRYEPWVHNSQKQSSLRPRGFMRGQWC